MTDIKINGKIFRKSITGEEINSQISRIAASIDSDYKGKKPLLLGVLNGCFMFASDLMKQLHIECEISFVKLSSYQGTTTTGTVSEVMGLSESVTGRDIIIVEDIVDTGLTMQRMIETLNAQKPASVAIASLFVKPARLKAPVDVKYSAFTIPDRFIVGYGLDYDGLGRNLPDIYDAVEEFYIEQEYNDFIRALLKGNVREMNKTMNELTLSMFSSFDVGNRPSERLRPERFYHGFVLGLLVELRNRYIVTSNRESGYGRYDVILEPEDPHENDGIILEFKVHDKDDGENTLEDTVKSALAQIEEMKYEQTLIDHGVPKEKIRKYGFAFEGKSVLIESSRIMK